MTWLLDLGEPAISALVRRHLLDESARVEASEIVTGPMVSALLSGQRDDGGFEGDPYRKWTGAHWRLVALADLEVPASLRGVAALAEHVLAWITHGLKWPPRVVDGLARSHGSIQGNALGACCRSGLAHDARSQRLAEALVSWQWPDGGWNCDNKASGTRSSFHETTGPAWGLYEYAEATGDPTAREAADRAAELFLEHQVFRRLSDGGVIHPMWLRLRYPPYWHYGVLPALILLTRMGRVRDPRAADALDELEARRRPDGRWAPDGRWWKSPDSEVTPDVVDWGSGGGPSPMLTFHALRILQAAGRLD